MLWTVGLCGCWCHLGADDTKKWGVVDTAEEWDAIQRVLDGLEQWAQVNFIKFNKVAPGSRQASLPVQAGG